MSYLRPCYFKHCIYSVSFHFTFILVFNRGNTGKRNFSSTNIISLKILNFPYLSAKKNQNEKPENIPQYKISLSYYEEITYPEEGIQGAILHVLSYDHYWFT